MKLQESLCRVLKDMGVGGLCVVGEGEVALERKYKEKNSK